jgi:hypothetical protein
MPSCASANETTLPRTGRPVSKLTIQLAAAAALVTFADFLFYRQRVGIALALFLAVLAAVSAFINPPRAAPTRRWRASMLLGAGLLPLVENPDLLSVTIALAATAACARTIAEAGHLSWLQHLRAALCLPFSGIFQLLNDLSRARRYDARRNHRTGFLIGAQGWMVPLLLCSVFVALFASANPLVEHWVSRIDLLAMLGQLFSARFGFWAVMLCLIWPLVRIRSLRCRTRRAPEPPATAISPPHPLDPLGDGLVRRSLILFNGLFAVQTVMDVVYLWGGASLPNGWSHATYAHRGAYPLVVTALLAAAFVLIAMRPSGPSEREPAVRPLVLAWVGQNVLLVLSALRRLDLYVDAYSLTELRLAAFVWMLLVMSGLVLMLVQIRSRRSLGWLVSANAMAMALTLYAYSFVDTAAVISNFNFRHSYEVRGDGQPIDLAYLLYLGPSVIPVIDRYVPLIVAADHTASPSRHLWADSGRLLAERRDEIARNHLEAQIGWRSWTFRGWRLSRYLANTPEAKFETMPESPAAVTEGK